MSYETPIKLTHRATVLELHNVVGKQLPIVYIDDDLGSATSYFLDKGIATNMLKPINFCNIACESIFHRTGVKANCMDVTKCPISYSCSVFWLDLQCKRVDKSLFTKMMCTFVIVTLSTRGSDPEAILKDAVLEMKRGGMEIMEMSRYKGKSNITNVIKIIGKKKEDKHVIASKKNANNNFSMVKKLAPNMKMKTKLNTVTKSVTKTKSVFKFSKLDIENLVGKNVYIPMSELTNGYEDRTQVKNTKYVFRTTRVYYRTRLEVRRILPNNTLSNEPEHWTLHPNDVLHYSSLF